MSLDKAIEKLKQIRHEMVIAKGTDELMDILLNQEEYEKDYIDLVKSEINKRVIN